MASDRLTVLIPVDFSEPSRRAMAWAFDYAQRAPCEVHLLHVVERHLRLADLKARGLEAITSELEEVRAQAESELSAMAPTQDAREAVGEIHQHIGSGKPADEILRIAKEIHPDLIVMGTHGLTGVGRMLIGSVAEAVVRRAPCTVVCVKPTAD